MVITTMYSPPPPYNDICSVPIVAQATTAIPINRYRQRKLICCCGARTWAIIIASFQIFLSMTTLVVRFLPASDYRTEQETLLDAPIRTTKLTDQAQDELSELDAYNKIYAHVSSDQRLQLLEGSMGLLLGSILLAGAQLGKPLLLLMWLIATGMGLVILAMLLSVLLLWVILGGGMIALFIFVILLIPFGIQAFCFRCVYIHRQEVIHQQSPNSSQLHHVLPFHSINHDHNRSLDKQKQNLTMY